MKTFSKIEGVREVSPVPFVSEMRRDLHESLSVSVSARCLESDSGKLAVFELTTNGSPYFCEMFRGKTVTFVRGERYSELEYKMYDEEPHLLNEYYGVMIDAHSFPHSLRSKIPGTKERAAWKDQKGVVEKDIDRIVAAGMEKSDLPPSRK